MPVARRLRALRLPPGRHARARRRTSAPPAFAVETVNKVQEGSPHIVDALQARRRSPLVINTPRAEAQELRDSFPIRRTALECHVPYFTTIAGGAAAAEAIAELKAGRSR